MTLAFTLLSNLLPLLGVLFLGWDVYTLLVYYWCETLIVAFWTVVTIACRKGKIGVRSDDPATRTGSPYAALLVAMHVGVFIAIHLLLMSTLYGQEWPGHLDSPAVFIETFIIGQGLWPMLTLTFIQRAAVFWDAGGAENLPPAVVGLYVRIAVIQVVIVLGAWGVMLLDSGLIGVVLLVAAKTMLDLHWPKVFTWIVASSAEARRR